MKAVKTWVLIVLLLIPAINVHAWPIPDTGQTKCYNNTSEIACPTPGQQLYGQDGNYTINPPSYTKLDANGNPLADAAATWSMVRDNVTGLIWEIKTDDGGIHDKDNTYTFCKNGTPAYLTCSTGTTESFIRTLNDAHFGGFSDWRMPTIRELYSLVNISSPSSGPIIDTAWFPNTMSSDYWSSETINSTLASYNAYSMNFETGNVSASPCCSSLNHYVYPSYYVRAVRAGSVVSGLVDNSDGTVTDKDTGLMWQRDTAPGTYTWQEALAYVGAAGLSIGGYTEWRLPNHKELQSLARYGYWAVHVFQTKPSIAELLVPYTTQSHYWSSTTHASVTSAWTVDFGNESGYPVGVNKSDSYYVRLVRGGQILIPGHLIVAAPSQGDMWGLGEQKNITWDTAGIAGNVRISLSRQGGKVGTFEVIIESTGNDGIYNWTVTGPASVNCVLRIEPLDEPSKAISQGLFSIFGGSVIINPDPDSISAQWTLTGPDGYSQSGTGDQTLTNLEPGDYTLTWGDVAGWDKPSPAAEAQAVMNGQKTTFTGTYVQQFGSLTVMITPQGDVGGQWRRVGTPAWFNSGATETGIPVGSYMVEFKGVLGWTTPGSQAVTIVKDQTTTATGTYVLQMGTIVINPEPNSINAPWTLTGPYSYSRTGTGDLTVSNLLVGNYMITWGAVSGWGEPSPAAETKAVTNGETTTFSGMYSFPIPFIYVTPVSLNYGYVPVGSTKDLSLTVQNMGVGTLTGNATTTAPFSIVYGGSYALDPGQSQVVTIRYQPTSQGPHTSTVVFTGGDGATVQVIGKTEKPLGLPWLLLLLGN